MRNNLILLVVAIVLQTACGAAVDDSDIGIAVPPVNNVANKTELKDLYGCWSTGNGMVLRIADGDVYLSTNRFKPVKFKQEISDSSTVVIRLLDRPQFYYLSEIVTMEFDADADRRNDLSLRHKSYQSLEDLDKKDSVGSNAWVRSEAVK